MFAAISRSSAETTPERTDDEVLQRSRGVLDLSFSTRQGLTYAERIFQQGAMKVRFPKGPKSLPPEAVILNTAGGLTDGDRLDIAIRMAEDSQAVVTSQACEKIYRALDGAARVAVTLSLDRGAEMEWLPQPAIFFDGARLVRQTHVEMAEGASLLALEGVVFGRAAMGETVSTGFLSDGWMIRRCGRLVHADRFESGGDMAAMLSGITVLGDNAAMATLRYVAADAEVRLEQMRLLLSESLCLSAASAWDGLMLVRFAARDFYTLNRELMRVLLGFRSRPMPRVWSI